MGPPPGSMLLAVEDRGPDRLRLRLKQLSWSAVTVVVTAWLCTFGPIPAILSLAVAKHILVAIIVMGVGLDTAADS
ncbi:MAG: hypothetical protein K1X57_00160 [Gemmataceae bacterium]|nr:hypothetical protein [Gemmataceae bacterium]